MKSRSKPRESPSPKCLRRTVHVAKRRYFCEHCQKEVARSTFLQHKRRYYVPSEGVWRGRENRGLAHLATPLRHARTDLDSLDPINIFSDDSSDDDVDATDHGTEQTHDEVPGDDSDSSGSGNTFPRMGESATSTESDSEEEWLDIDREQLLGELRADYGQPRTNLLENGHHQHRDPLLQTQSRLLSWLLYFILMWKCCNFISDNAINQLIVFLYQFFSLMSGQDKCIASLMAVFPASLYLARKCLGLERDDFQRYVVCQKCTKLYTLDECTTETGEPRRCTNILFPKGKFKRHCEGKLVKEVRLKDGSKHCVPLSTYCYKSLTNSLESLCQRPGFEDACNWWKTRQQSPEIYGDVFDGKVWQQFRKHEGRDFLDGEHSYGLMLNCDWFAPYERIKSISIGVLYMVCMNLPREVRFKRENVIIVGVIPDLPTEPHDLRHFVEPLVTELQQLWTGVPISTNLKPAGTTARAALLCAAADVPAARKLCGFMGHGAKLGCSKCLRKAEGGFGEKKDWGDFDKASWPPRNREQHKRALRKLMRCKTKTAAAEIERQTGVRWTPFENLEYFDAIRFHIVDPMHNLYLGTAKKLFGHWINLGLLDATALKLVESRNDDVQIPGDFGRIPSSISSNWGGFTANQWQNWTLIYSLYSLNGVLPEEHYKCWQTFVLACRKICQPVISQTDSVLADKLFLKFGKTAIDLYGKQFITPNMHLHCHLIDSVQDYGSVFGFWLYSFERYNGIMASFHNNRHAVEVQMMRQFLTLEQLHGIRYSLPSDYNSEFGKSLENVGVRSYSTAVCLSVTQFGMATAQLSSCLWCDTSHITLPNKRKLVSGIDNDDVIMLYNTYKAMYPSAVITVDSLCRTYHRYLQINIGSELFSCIGDRRLCKYSNVYAHWSSPDGTIDGNTETGGRITFFMTHNIVLDGKSIEHVFAHVRWYLAFTDKSMPTPIRVYQRGVYVPPGPASYIPVQRIAGKQAIIESMVDTKPAMLAIPVSRRMYF